VKKTTCWAIKLKRGKFVCIPFDMKYWEAERTMTFRTRKFAQAWLDNDPFWKGKGDVVKVTITVREAGE
jgi:hypothetical protein